MPIVPKRVVLAWNHSAAEVAAAEATARARVAEMADAPRNRDRVGSALHVDLLDEALVIERYAPGRARARVPLGRTEA